MFRRPQRNSNNPIARVRVRVRVSVGDRVRGVDLARTGQISLAKHRC